MPSQWSVLHYGKLIEPDTGSTVSGRSRGYTRTGSSSAFPQELISACDPVDVGVSDQAVWSKYQWRGGQGTLVLRPVRAGDLWYLQAIRLLVRGEDSGGQSGRYFHQTAYLVLPVSKLTDPHDLLGLPEAAQATLFTEKRFDLPPVTLAGRDQALPGGWFDDDLRMMLAAVVSGYGVAVRALGTSPDDFFRLALWCAACLPRAIRWRLPIGAGFYETPEGFGIAHGQGVRGKVRQVEGAWRQADDVDLSAGREYVDWIAPAAERAGSLSELMEQVDAQFRTLADPALGQWDGIAEEDGSMPWTEAMGLLMEAVRYKPIADLVTAAPDVPAAARRDPGWPRRLLSAFTRLRRQVLEQLLRAVGTRRPVFRSGRQSREEETQEPEPPPAALLLLETVRTDWHPVWTEVAATGSGETARLARTLGTLLGIFPIDPQRIDPDLAGALPAGAVHEAAALLGRTTAGLTIDNGAAGWAPLIRAAGRGDAPPVLRAWREASELALVWLGVGLELLDSRVTCVSAWEPSAIGPAAQAAQAALTGSLTSLSDWVTLCQSVGPRFVPVAARWPEHLSNRGLALEALVLAALTPYNNPAAGTTRASSAGAGAATGAAGWLGAVPSGQRTQATDRLLDEIERRPRLGSTLVLPLLLWWNDLTADQHRRASPVIEEAVTPAFAHIVFCRPLPGYSIPELSADEARTLSTVLAGDRARQERVIALLRSPSTASMRAQLIGVLEDLASQAAAAAGLDLDLAPAVELVRAVFFESGGRCPELTAADARTVADLAGAFAARGRSARPIPADQVTSLGQLRGFVAVAGSDLSRCWAEPLDRFWPEILAACAADPDDARFWGERVRTARLEASSLFRLLTNPSRAFEKPTSQEEHVLVRYLPDAAFLHFLWVFESWSGPIYSRLLFLLNTSDAVAAVDLRYLAEAARSNRQPLLYDAVLRCAVRRLMVYRRSRTEVRVLPGTGGTSNPASAASQWEELTKKLIDDAWRVLDSSDVRAWEKAARGTEADAVTAGAVFVRVRQRPSID